uniref:Uncharacterized protein n=1 Tax=Anguilla anguilla TaxID=7936 RepID=A0A0E9P993_ANGAN
MASGHHLKFKRALRADRDVFIEALLGVVRKLEG